MPDEELAVNAPTLDVKSVLKELEVPFSPHQVQWRVTNMAKDRKRGQIVPYADPRAYADRLNALFTPQGWAREYRVETLGNITRVKGGENIVTGKILVTCTVTIIGLWSHSGTGEEWADDANAMTAADAQAFKRACSCFGLGRYLYEFHGSWVDLDQNLQPKQMAALAGWAIPENWRNGIRSPAINGNGHPRQGSGSNANGHSGPKSNGRKPGSVTNSADELDIRITALEKPVGARLYRSVLREFGKAEHPHQIKDAQGKQKVLQILESAVRGVQRLNAIKRRVDPKVLESLLAKVQARSLYVQAWSVFLKKYRNALQDVCFVREKDKMIRTTRSNVASSAGFPMRFRESRQSHQGRSCVAHWLPGLALAYPSGCFRLWSPVIT